MPPLRAVPPDYLKVLRDLREATEWATKQVARQLVDWGAFDPKGLSAELSNDDGLRANQSTADYPEPVLNANYMTKELLLRGLNNRVAEQINQRLYSHGPLAELAKSFVLCGTRSATLAAILRQAQHTVFFTGYYRKAEGGPGHVWLIAQALDFTHDCQPIEFELDAFRDGGLPTDGEKLLRNGEFGFTEPL
ncbi:MAG TPA: hypothetical protein VGP72_00345 [Planctomycetota bacterium]|jgi:hypothetical protein